VVALWNKLDNHANALLSQQLDTRMMAGRSGYDNR
jgi:hypothetical protein